MTTATAGTKGFLFCDLRGYAAFVEAKGDRAAAELLETYRTLVRGVIAAHEGAEIRTEGDSVYVVFAAASSAVEAGLGIVEGAEEASTSERPIRVGVGIHAGETVATTEGLVGGAVNIAARVCAKAHGGEVLVTDTVRSLTRTSLPYAYVGLGSHSLKGIEGGIPLYRVEAVASGRLAHLRRRLSAHRRLVAGAAGGLIVLLAAGAALYLVNRPPDCLALSADTKDVVARIDPARMCVVQVIPVGERPNSIVATDTAIWVANETDWTVTRIDLATRSATRWLGTPGSPISLAVHADGQVDVLANSQSSGAYEQRVVWIDAAGEDHLVVSDPLPWDPPFTIPGAWTVAHRSTYRVLTAANDWTWVVSARKMVVRISHSRQDGQSAELSGTSDVSDPALIAATGGTVWIADRAAPAVYRYEGPPDEPAIVSLDGKGGTRALAVTPTELWLLRESGSLTHLDAVTRETRTLVLDAPATALAVGPTSVWLLDATRHTVRSVDPPSGRTIKMVDVGGEPASAIFAHGALWVTIGKG